MSVRLSTSAVNCILYFQNMFNTKKFNRYKYMTIILSVVTLCLVQINNIYYFDALFLMESGLFRFL